MRSQPSSPKPADAGHILATLQGSSLFKEAAAKHAALVVEERKALVARRARLERAGLQQSEKLSAEETAAVTALKAVETALAEAKAKVGEIQYRRIIASNTRQAEMCEIDTMLRDGTAPAVAAFISAMHDEKLATRKAFSYIAHDEETNAITGKRERKTVNNRVSIDARLAAIDAAIEAAEALVLEPDQAIVPTRLEELTLGLPAVAQI